MKTLKQIIGEAIGEASMCWELRPSNQVFKSEEASAITDKTCHAITELISEMVGGDKTGSGNADDQQFSFGFVSGWNNAKAEIRERIKQILK